MTPTDRQWLRFFECALHHEAVLQAELIADAAMAVFGKRFPEPPPEPLFNPLLRERAAKQTKDDDDSAFGVA